MLRRHMPCRRRTPRGSRPAQIKTAGVAGNHGDPDGTSGSKGLQGRFGPLSVPGITPAVQQEGGQET
ncbi:hypothetical protein CBM2585_A200160 [Cupriavidus taiwanensis]|nr:hypothetical protein CBM2585_A200160 [Cupriavidus taiwanensis]